MKWVRFRLNGKTAYGVVEGDRVVQVEGTPFGRFRRTRASHPLTTLKLLAPVIPPTFYAAGVNYAAHVDWANEYWGRDTKVPSKADIGYRASNALIAHGDPIVIPTDASDAIHYENELVAVIGKEAKGLPESDALTCVLGYTIGNDVSERTWQHDDRTLWRAKNSDTFKPMGPWIETDLDVSGCQSVTRINGAEVSRFQTSNFVFGIAHYISVMSKYLTLHPGDVIWMGTDGPTVPPLTHGDVVECEITGLGVLRNPVRRVP